MSRASVFDKRESWEGLVQSVRQGGLAEALNGDLRLLVLHGYLLSPWPLETPARKTTPLHFSGTTVPAAECRLERVADPALEGANLFLYRVAEPAEASTPDMSVAALGLAWRLGLALQMLDLVQLHLVDRVSGGMKTLQHESVRAQISEFLVRFEAVAGALEDTECRIQDRTSEHIELLHDELTEGTACLAKLMGGHGYLTPKESSLARLAYLSTVLRALFGRPR